ncbi:MAG: hypothetical protein LUD02_14630 [Tannerellaceae bacterium]|nr:hypothetical protein [Tannerellaceae bacterium]
MQPYKNLSGRSGVRAYVIGADYILVLFIRGNRVYNYTYTKAGVQHVENMKRLAELGKGLNTYINKYARELFD